MSNLLSCINNNVHIIKFFYRNTDISKTITDASIEYLKENSNILKDNIEFQAINLDQVPIHVLLTNIDLLKNTNISLFIYCFESDYIDIFKSCLNNKNINLIPYCLGDININCTNLKQYQIFKITKNNGLGKKVFKDFKASKGKISVWLDKNDMPQERKIYKVVFDNLPPKQKEKFFSDKLDCLNSIKFNIQKRLLKNQIDYNSDKKKVEEINNQIHQLTISENLLKEA